MVPLLLLSILAVDGPRWDLVESQKDLALFSRASPSSGVLEMKATGMVDAPPQVVWSVLKDLDHYQSFMPFTTESRVLHREGERVVYFYSRIEPPLVSARDYFIKLVDESQWDEGRGFLKVTWTISPDGSVPPRPEVVHIAVNDGAWLLEPRENGTRTFLSYPIHIRPGGVIPDLVANRANTTSVPRVFQTVKQVAERPGAK